MKTIAVFAIVCLAAVFAAPSGGTYTTKYDGINLDEILKSDRLLHNYVKCLLDQGRCTPDGNELKRVLPDALKSDCSKCSEAQRNGSEQVIRFLIKNKQNWWKPLEEKYDPTGVYIASHPELTAN